ncbi:MAG: malto-oligosyltrehalose synthase, partial [Vulcanimicrobiaceae bacterium]
VNPRSEAAFDRIYESFAGVEASFDDVAYESKQYVITNVLSSELTWLATALFRIALSDMRSSDFTYDGLRDGIAAVVASFPVYRTYVAGWSADEEDRRFIEWAVLQAEKRSPLVDESIFVFISDALTLRILELPDAGYTPADVLHFIMRFQQYTGPVMAKAMEDTAFYRYVRLLSLNEVGGDPRRFGSSAAAFHRQNGNRATDFPHAMLATATHDHKRGEDTRLRIDGLSEMPGRWRKMLRFLTKLAKPRAMVDALPAPSKRDQYAIYQMLVGTWPMAWLDGAEVPEQGEVDDYLERISQWVRKSMREAKLNSSWERPNPPYEDATLDFVRRLFEGSASRILFREFRVFVQDVAFSAMVSGLSQTSIKLTSPGIPDTYQGCELWDLSMVDPDNRKPVDFEMRTRLLSQIKTSWNAEERLGVLRDLLRSWRDGRVKMFVTWRLLQLRKEHPQTFLDGAYRRLSAGGKRAASIVAYARDRIVVVAPRLVYSLLKRSKDGLPVFEFGSEYVTLPPNFPRRFRNIFTGAIVEADSSGRPRLMVQALFADFPVAVLVPI